ncbi:MAG: IclR family transcriptional regulator C-terminal domain-containing protein [Arenimonas sp.]
MRAQDFDESPDFVQSLARGLQVLRAFDHSLPQASLSEIADRTGLARAVVRRNLLTLQHLGYVSAKGRQFLLTPRVLELGYSYLSSLGLGTLAQQPMEQLSERVEESCSLSVLDGGDIVYVQRIPVRKVMSMALGIGARLPAFAASMGRVMLADLSSAALGTWLREHKLRSITPATLHTATALKSELTRVRNQGYALVAQELELGLCSIAVPIRAGDGRVVAGLNVSMQYSDGVREAATARMLPALRGAQQAIERALAGGGNLPLLLARGGGDG